MSRGLQARRNLEQQRRFSDAGLATDEGHRAWNEASAKDEIELVDAGLPATCFGSMHLSELGGGRDPARSSTTGAPPCTRGTDRRDRHLFDERIPRTAHIAATSPLGVIGAAFRT